jgi:protein TonB
MVNFIVTQTGQIQDVHALKHPNKVYNSALIQEAERLIRSMPNWTPGKIKGRVVACRFNMPVKFILP